MSSGISILNPGLSLAPKPSGLQKQSCIVARLVCFYRLVEGVEKGHSFWIFNLVRS